MSWWKYAGAVTEHLWWWCLTQIMSLQDMKVQKCKEIITKIPPSAHTFVGILSGVMNSPYSRLSAPHLDHSVTPGEEMILSKRAPSWHRLSANQPRFEGLISVLKQKVQCSSSIPKNCLQNLCAVMLQCSTKWVLHCLKSCLVGKLIKPRNVCYLR